jgi:hypothetical protein
MWNHKIGDATIQCGAELAKDYPTWGKWPTPSREKLTTAVNLAPTMVSDAIQALRAHLFRHDISSARFRSARRNLQGPLAKDPSVENVDHTEVGQGLIRYFNLKYSPLATDIYWFRVQNICSTGGQIMHQPDSRYVIFEQPVQARNIDLVRRATRRQSIRHLVFFSVGFEAFEK